MSVFRVQIISVLMSIFFQDQRSIREMDPWLRYEDERWIFIFKEFQEVKSITGAAFYVPR